MEGKHRRDEVFGVQRNLPLNYITREDVDDVLVDYLTRQKHVVIFGSSKQGKTSLRKNTLLEDDYIVVQCSNKWTLADLHTNILKRAGYRITVSEKKTVAGSRKLLANFGGAIFGVGAKAGGEQQKTKSAEVLTEPLELDPTDVNDVIEALELSGFSRFVVLEDFHYLDTETQKDFSVSLKAFHEGSSICFMIVGVWLEENRLIVFNGDLTGRMATVSTDEWTKDDLLRVIAAGEQLLNVQFDETLVDDLLKEAKGSVYLVQEVCRMVCEKSDVSQTLEQLRVVGEGVDVSDEMKKVVNQQSGRYRAFISNFASGFQKSELGVYRWLLYSILTRDTDTLRKGIALPQIMDDILKAHPESNRLRHNNVTQALKAAAALQIKKEITPLVCDYDSTNLRLNIVDRGFLVWLDFQENSELLRHANLPVPDDMQV